MNGAGVCWIIRTFFHVYICLKHNKAVLLRNLGNFYIQVFSVNDKSVLLETFVKYTLSKLYSHCTQNCKFYYFLETRICFVKKDCSISS